MWREKEDECTCIGICRHMGQDPDSKFQPRVSSGLTPESRFAKSALPQTEKAMPQKMPEPQELFLAVDCGIDGRAVERINSVHVTQEAAAKAISNNHYLTVRKAWGILFVDSDYSNYAYILQDKAPLPIGVNIEDAKKKLREQALAKLSPAEKASLGITD